MKKKFHEIFSDYESKFTNSEEDVTSKRMRLEPSSVLQISLNLFSLILIKWHAT